MSDLLTNTVEFTVSELAQAVKQTIEDQFDYVRVRGEISGFRGRHSSGHAYFTLKDEDATIDAVIWKTHLPAPRLQARGGLRGHRHRAAHHLPEVVEVPDRHRPARARRCRRADGAARGAPQEARRRGPVRRRAQAPAALPAARHRRHHLADRRGDPRHPPPPRRPLPEPRPGLAGARPGRHLRRRSRRRHRRLQPPPARRPDPAARRADRRPRRRLDRGPLGLQRRDRRPRRRRQRDPADLRRRPRDRHHADRLRRRPPRADADRRRRSAPCRCAPNSSPMSTTWARARRQAVRRTGANLRDRWRAAAAGLPRPENLLSHRRSSGSTLRARSSRSSLLAVAAEEDAAPSPPSPRASRARR